MKKGWIFVAIFWLTLFIFSIFSYSQTDPNLVIINHDWFWQFQQKMWSWGGDRVRLVRTYELIIFLLFSSYFGLVWVVKKSSKRLNMIYQQRGFKYLLSIFLLLISPLLLAYNALSHDVFNYMFNAKMVVFYHANPHQQVALDFPQDEWLRFMHNTHTPAPYAYGWTVFSLIPYFFGSGKFLSTWLMFRLASLVGLALLLRVFIFHFEKAKRSIDWAMIALVVLNPLLLIEVIGNQHNDLWMMVPALTSLLWLAHYSDSKKRALLAWLMFIFAASIKYATLILTPFYLLIAIFENAIGFIQKKIKFLAPHSVLKMQLKSELSGKLIAWVALISSVFIFLLLTIPRSQQFHPWYLTWVMVWLPLFPRFRRKITSPLSRFPFAYMLLQFQQIINFWIQTIIIFSITSMLRYVPWLATGGFSPEILNNQRVITWSALIISPLYSLVSYRLTKINWQKYL